MTEPLDHITVTVEATDLTTQWRIALNGDTVGYRYQLRLILTSGKLKYMAVAVDTDTNLADLTPHALVEILTALTAIMQHQLQSTSFFILGIEPHGVKK